MLWKFWLSDLQNTKDNDGALEKCWLSVQISSTIHFIEKNIIHVLDPSAYANVRNKQNPSKIKGKFQRRRFKLSPFNGRTRIAIGNLNNSDDVFTLD